MILLVEFLHIKVFFSFGSISYHQSIYCSILITNQATATDLILWGQLLSIDSVKVQIVQGSERKRDSVNNLGIVHLDMRYLNSEAKKHINKK